MILGKLTFSRGKLISLEVIEETVPENMKTEITVIF